MSKGGANQAAGWRRPGPRL